MVLCLESIGDICGVLQHFVGTSSIHKNKEFTHDSGETRKSTEQTEHAQDTHFKFHCCILFWMTPDVVSNLRELSSPPPSILGAGGAHLPCSLRVWRKHMRANVRIICRYNLQMSICRCWFVDVNMQMSICRCHFANVNLQEHGCENCRLMSAVSFQFQQCLGWIGVASHVREGLHSGGYRWEAFKVWAFAHGNLVPRCSSCVSFVHLWGGLPVFVN